MGVSGLLGVPIRLLEIAAFCQPLVQASEMEVPGLHCPARAGVHDLVFVLGAGDGFAAHDAPMVAALPRPDPMGAVAR